MRTPSILPWLLASTVLHALLLTQWPDTARQPTGTGGAQVPPIRIQVHQAAPVTTADAASVAAAARPAPPQPARATADPAPAPQAVAAAVAAPAPPDDRPYDTADTARDRSVAAPAAERASAPAVAASVPERSTGDAADSAWLELTALLHQAIDRHKRYPQSALQMGREGAARIDFLLGPDGRIDELNIGHSSGVRALDLAAFRAVQAIAPFNDAHRYLDRARRFQVDVVFRIN